VTTQPDPATVIDDPKSALIDAAEIRFEPVRVPLAYQFGLAIVAVAMLLLPAIYVALIGVLAAGTWYWATHAGAVIFGAGGISLYAAAAYVGPIFAGAAGVLFMIKPLFAQHPKPPAPVTVDPAQEPTLHAFVRRLCRAIGAPPPREIDVDLTVNASASFRHGMRSMFGRDLVLTIGLPLVTGFDVRQFAGVLAHEFGHFTQATAMRFSYVIGSVNHWFARVVFERDEWDLSLEQARAKTKVGGVALVLGLASICIWISRRILRLLMHAGHGLSCYLMRQMEYNADAHQAQVAGSDSVRETLLGLAMLEVAKGVAEGQVDQLWAEGRKATDFPSLIRLHADQVRGDAEAAARLDQAVLQQKATLFDTHPSAADRIRHAEGLKAVPAITSAQPATALFHRFEQISEEVTARAYRLAFGEQAEAVASLSARDAADDAARASAGWHAVDRLVFRTPVLQFGVAPRVSSPTPAASVAEGVAALAEARERMIEAWPALPSILSRYEEMLKRLYGAAAALALDNAGVPYWKASFDLPTEPPDELWAIKHDAEAERLQLRGELAPVFDAVAARADAAVALALHPDIRRGLGASSPTAEALSAPIGALQVIVEAWAQIADLHSNCTHIALLSRAAASHEREEQFQRSGSRLLAETHDLLERLFARLNETPYPYDHGRGPVSIARYAVPELPRKGIAILQDAGAAQQRIMALYHRCWGELATLVEQVEQAVGLPALEVPDVGAGSEESNQPHE
jgi:Zn-dependent protease with chaperone function